MNTLTGRLILDIRIWREAGPNAFKGSLVALLVHEKPDGEAFLS
jgi:hypothetical protein